MSDPSSPSSVTVRTELPGAAPAGTLTVAVISGGRSSEHDVSLASGAAIRDGLLAAGHEVVPVEIDRDGAWRCDGEPVDAHPGQGLLGVDVAFPALHGPFGEDGSVQGLLETLDVAYVGAGVAASAVCMDKVLFKRLLSATSAAVPQVDYVGVREARWRAESAQVLSEIAELGLPVFVKPAHLGSSVGIVRIAESALVADALEQAYAHDELAIVEAMALPERPGGVGLGARRDRFPRRVVRLRGEVFPRRDGADRSGSHLGVSARAGAGARRRDVRRGWV
jgi:D-alanine--D-alanine ligase